jgi:hypothetical protein
MEEHQPGGSRCWSRRRSAAGRTENEHRAALRGPIRFEAAAGEHVLLTGADRLTDWRKVDEARPIYRLAWPHRFITWNRSMTHPDDEHHRLIGRCEQVIVDGLLLRQVLSADQIAPGAFFADVTNQTLVLWDIGSRDANKLHVKPRPAGGLRVEGDHVRVRGCVSVTPPTWRSVARSCWPADTIPWMTALSVR